MGQKSLLQKVQIFLFFLSSVMFSMGGRGLVFSFFVSKIASDMIEWMNGW